MYGYRIGNSHRLLQLHFFYVEYSRDFPANRWCIYDHQFDIMELEIFMCTPRNRYFCDCQAWITLVKRYEFDFKLNVSGNSFDFFFSTPFAFFP